MKLQNEFTKRLRNAILENAEGPKQLYVTKYYCSGCDGLLFNENDILNHVPIYTPSYEAQNL